MNENRIGESNIANNGMQMTIIDYRGCNDVDVQFEDGTIVNTEYGSFKKGNIKNPNLLLNKRIGENNIAYNGQKMTIIAYRGCRDIDIQFEDGTIVTNKNYKAFIIGKIKNPNLLLNIRIGETHIANNGQKMTIIAYRKSNDIDIQFEDGTIVTNKSYKEFIDGVIKNPNYGISNIRIGETSISTKGMKMTIIDYRGCNDIDIQFEDGYIAKNKIYSAFRKGNIKHPFPYRFNDMLIRKPAYVQLDNIGNFICTCLKCGHKDIMDMEEMRNHICEGE